METKYQAVVKWNIDNRVSNAETGWMYYEGANKFHNRYIECLISVGKEIDRRKNTEQPITKYRIYKWKEELVTEELVDGSSPAEIIQSFKGWK